MPFPPIYRISTPNARTSGPTVSEAEDVDFETAALDRDSMDIERMDVPDHLGLDKGRYPLDDIYAPIPAVSVWRFADGVVSCSRFLNYSMVGLQGHATTAPHCLLQYLIRPTTACS